MKIEIVEVYGSWNSVKRAALKTIGKRPVTAPTEKWIKSILLPEHSPIRLLAFSFNIDDVEAFVQTHLARHHIGVEKFISTMRNDLIGIEGAKITRDSKNNMEFYCNAQALISISRKRLCLNAHKTTVSVWKAVLAEVKKFSPTLYSVCVPECVYRGFCPEIKKCGYSETNAFQKALIEYRKV